MQLQGRNLQMGSTGQDVALLQQELAQLGYEIDRTEERQQEFGATTQAAVVDVQRAHGLPTGGVVDTTTAATLARLLAAHTLTVRGQVASQTRAGVGGLRVLVVDKNVGADLPLAEAITADDGAYEVRFVAPARSRGRKQQLDLQARVQRGETFLAASPVRYNVSNRERLDVTLNERADALLPSEHETLTAALTAHLASPLRDLQEQDDRRDITYLARKTGWDARAVALAALADQLSDQSTEDGGARLDPALFYALLRAGLPADGSALFSAGAGQAETIWRQAAAQGVIPALDDATLAAAARRLRVIATRRVLDDPPPVGLSSLRALLVVSQIDQPRRQEQFAALVVQHQGAPSAFWDAVRAEFGAAAERRLRLDGQLDYLTLNNAPLISRLHAAAGAGSLESSEQLADDGYYRAERWRQILGDDAIPAEITGDGIDDRRTRYAETLAAMVRLSFPTAVVAAMVRNGETPVADGAAAAVHDFLREHRGRFEIGAQPVEQYLARNNVQLPAAVRQEVERIQRVWNITPSDAAMNALLRRGVDSAFAVTRYSQDQFIRAFQDDLGGAAYAQQVHSQAQDVHNVILNAAYSYRMAGMSLGIGEYGYMSYLNGKPTAANAGDVIAYPTLEGLFGEMDFCDCEHCRSFLSPAAYLVDLLLFLEPDSAAWAQELADWQAAHGNAPYPFQTLQAWQAAGQPAPLKPLQVLLERRPDIQHLPLTCENTNKPLPAIDLVNETLEYFIVNRERPFSLEDYQGHSTTADIPAQELLASPQHVQDEAYDLLAETFFPPPLPFHQPLENLRLCFDRFGVPLPAVMEALSPHDALDRPDRPGSYGWRDILMEEIQLSRAEHKLLTNYDLDPPRNQALTLNRLYGYDLSLPEAAVVADLSNVKTFARRVGITYEEVYAVLRTRFVNPGSTLLPRLEALGVPFSTLKALRDGAIAEIDFGNLLPRGLNPAAYGGDPAALTGGSRNYVAVMGAAVKAWVASAYDDIMGLITAANPGDEEDLCSFESLELRYADPDKIAAPVRAFEFIRLIRFIRLWKKLGWTIEQTDKAITALYPVSQTPNHPSDDAVNRQRLDAGFLALLPRLGVIRRLMTTLKLKPKKDLLPLLACFAPIDTHGAASLYRQMFLAKPLPRQDPAFADDGFGRFLTGDERLLDHAGELRAAFQLTSVEFDEIAAALGFDEDTPLGRRLTLEEMAARLGRTPTATEQALLTDTYRVENISALFRWGWLARKLKLSVRELRALSQVTGNDPFAAPDPPAPAILGFIDFLQRLRAASLKPVEALYLIWNQDISGRSAPAAGEILELARTLRRELAAIEREYALVDDPDGQIARTRLAQVFGNAAADHFFGLLEGAVLSDVPYSHDTEDGALEQPILDAAGGRLSYDSMRKRLAFAGAMPDASRAALLAVPGVTAAFAAAVTELHSKSWAFFDRYPQLRPHYDAYAASSDPAETKRFNLLAALLPELKRLRKRQQAIQVVAATAQADATLAGALLDDARVLQAAGNDSQPAMDDLTALEQAGLTAQFFFAGVIGREPDEQRDGQAPIDYGAAGGNNLPANSVSPGDPIACVWSGYLEAPENGFYNLTVQADAGATVHLALDGQDVELALLDGSPTWSNQAAIELTAGKLYPITLAVEQVRATLILRWESTGRGREVIPPPQLYSSTLAERLAAVYVRLLKTAALAAALRLSVGEVVHFATQPTYQIDDRGWLNSLPVEGSPDVATGAGLLAAFDALIAFARLKAEFSPSDERLLAVLIDPLGAARVTRENMDSLLFSLTRWEPRSLDGLLEHLRLAVADLARVETLHRVWQAYGPLKKLRVPVAVLLGSATNAPSAAAVRELHAALRARYDQDDWLNVLQPINDRLRGRQRDALVAFILHHLRANAQTRHIDTADKLFEYFLMDVQMEPCMQTSRIRHALSAVQLFVERCFMNLEPRVAPSALAANHWAWMKRYRVWEANRKIFLWPENWLEPELRGDQSPFFKEAVSELLQSDITEERAAMALLNYLAKLDEVAKLEPCGIFYAEGDSASERDVTHVVARTAGANRKYFYRRRSDNDGPWTPWEQIKLDIEGNPVLPVVWKGRLFLFWVRILMQAPLDPPDHLPETGTLTDNPPADLLPKTAPKVTVQAILCWSEYYNNKWQTPRTSAISSPATVIKVPADRFSRSRLSLSVFDTGLDMLQVSVGYGGLMDNYLRSSFRLYNTHSNPSSTQYGPETPIDHHHTESLSRHIYGTLLAFDPAKASDLTISYNSGPGTTPFKHVVLGKTDLGEAITQPFHKLMVSWLAPFFYEDKRHVFYVTTQISHKAALSVETYHPQGAPQPLAMDIPPLEWTVKPKPWDPPVDGFLFEDAIVNKVIATTGEVRYGGLPISPAGGLHPTDTIEEV